MSRLLPSLQIPLVSSFVFLIDLLPRAITTATSLLEVRPVAQRKEASDAAGIIARRCASRGLPTFAVRICTHILGIINDIKLS